MACDVSPVAMFYCTFLNFVTIFMMLWKMGGFYLGFKPLKKYLYFGLVRQMVTLDYIPV